MTNIEELVNQRERTRPQNNYDAGFTQDVIFIRARHPDPAPAQADAYQGRDLAEEPLRDGSTPSSLQVILDEDPRLSESYRKLRSLRSERRQLYQERRAALRSAYLRLKEEHRTVPRFVSRLTGRIREIRIPPKYAYVYAGGSKVVERWVRLNTPRKQYKRVLVGLRYVTTRRGGKRLQKLYESRLVDVYPRVWRRLVIPIKTKVQIRPARTIFRAERVREKIMTIDWVSLLSEYANIRSQVSISFRTRIDELTAQIDAIQKGYSSQPHHALSYTQCGMVGLPSTLNNVPRLGYARPTGTFVSRFSTTNPRTRYLACLAAPLGLRAFSDPSDMASYIRGLAYEVPIRDQFWIQPVARNKANYHVGQIRSSNMISDGEYSDRRNLAYSSVASLTNAKDYAFQWFRSTMELRDLPKTLRGGRDFLRFLGNRKQVAELLQIKKFQAFKTVGRAIAAAYLSYKFAIEPTVQDVETVLHSTASWILETHRSLAKAVDSLRRPSNRMHVRSAFGSRKRLSKISTVPSERSDREIELSYDWILRSEPYLGVTANVNTDAEGFQVVEANISPDGLPLNEQVLVLPDINPSITLTSSVLDSQLTVENIYVPPTGSLSQISGCMWGVPNPDCLRAEISAKTTETHVYVPVYCVNHRSGVVFAQYAIEDILAILSHGSGDLYAAVSSWLDQSLNVGRRFLSSLDVVKTSWELTPLSFIYDWFTNSGQIATLLANSARTNWNLQVQPNPLTGIWESQRVELMTGVPSYRIDSIEGRMYVPDFATVAVHIHGNSPWYCASPRRVVGRTRIRLVADDPLVTIRRSGLYRFRRGLADAPSLTAYLPRLSVNLDRGKLLSLASVMFGFAGQ